MLKLIIRGELITLDGGQWEGASPSLLEKLEAVTDDAGDDLSGADPTPDLTICLAVIKALSGRVLSYQSPEYVEGRIY